MVRFLLSALVVLIFSVAAPAQIREIPVEVKAAFKNQYPKADSVTYEDKLILVQVHFVEGGGRYMATYANSGLWRETHKEWTFEALPEAVKDGFSKSKYADWKVAETRIVYRTGVPERYRIKVESNELIKKNLLFNSSGRLLEDQITL